jgi:hypothetical protein
MDGALIGPVLLFVAAIVIQCVAGHGMIPGRAGIRFVSRAKHPVRFRFVVQTWVAAMTLYIIFYMVFAR